MTLGQLKTLSERKQDKNTEKRDGIQTAINFIATRKRRFSWLTRVKTMKGINQDNLNFFFLNCPCKWEKSKATVDSHTAGSLASFMKYLPCWNQVGTAVFRQKTKLNTRTVLRKDAISTENWRNKCNQGTHQCVSNTNKQTKKTAQSSF